MTKTGPARCFTHSQTFKPTSKEFQIHYLIEKKPVCGFETDLDFIEVVAPIGDIAPWKKCPGCFKG